MSEKNLPLSGEEIILDKDKTFAYFMYGTFVRELPPILLKEIKTIIRQLVKSGKNTLLVQNGKGIEKYVINTFIALKKESPSLRIIKVVYKNDSCDLAISDLADHVLFVKNNKQFSVAYAGSAERTAKHFIIAAASTLLCYTPYNYRYEKFLENAQEKHTKIINLFRVDLHQTIKTNFKQLFDLQNLLPEKIVDNLDILHPFIPSFIINDAKQIQSVINAYYNKYKNSLEKFKKITFHHICSFAYYFYLLGYRDAEREKQHE